MEKEKLPSESGEEIQDLIAKILSDNFEKEYLELAGLLAHPKEKDSYKFARKAVISKLEEQLPNYTKEEDVLKIKQFINRLKFIDEK